MFALKQALALYDAFTDQVRECDAEIERRFQAIKPVWSDALPPLKRGNKHRTHNKNAPTYDAHSLLYQLVGVDLIAIPGLNASTVQTILSEIGLDLHMWPHAKAFCSWLGSPPTTDLGRQDLSPEYAEDPQSGRSSLSSGGASGQSQPQQLGSLLPADAGPPRAESSHRGHCPQARAHRLSPPHPSNALPGSECRDYEQQARQREIVTLRKKAAKLGLALVESPT